MPRWMKTVAWIVPVAVLAGCLPPVQESTDTTPPAMTDPEKSASAQEPPAAPSTAPDADGFLTTPSGLKYKVVREGTGKKPRRTDTVSCHYRGWLDNGKEFDSSYTRGEPTEFPLNGVIAGWTEGLQLIGEGGEIELKIPSRLGYGPGGIPGTIPGGANLNFKVELQKIL